MENNIKDILGRFRKEFPDSEYMEIWGESVEAFLEKELALLVEKTEKRSYLKGMAFAYHTCDCEYCHSKNLECLTKLSELRKSI